MKKRLISLFFTVLMMLSLFSMYSVSANAEGTINFEYNPTVLIGGGTEYNVIWKNNVNSIGYITYTYNGKTYTAYDREDGVVRSDDSYHTVRIPMEHLNNATKITAVATAVSGRNGFDITLGASVEKNVKLKVWKRGAFNIGCFSDLHLYDTFYSEPLARSKYAKDNYMDNLALVCLLGDVSSVATSEQYLKNLFWACSTMGEDGTPVLYLRGNHESRGEWSQIISRYFKFDTDECYSTFNLGPMSAIVSDSGEDKIDLHMEYGDQNDMEHYKKEQLEWFLENGEFDEDSLYNISFSHSHNLVDVYYTDEFIQMANELGVDLHINGHTHQLRFKPADDKYHFPQLHDGGHDNNTTMRTSMVTLYGNNIFYKGFSDSGSVLIEGSTPVVHGKAAKGVSVEQFIKKQASVEAAPWVEEETVDAAFTVENETIPTAAGVAAITLRAASNVTAITVKPTVFDGGKYYNVVWQTTPGIKACGEVVIIDDTTTDVGYITGNFVENTTRYQDSVSGKVRTDSIHSVKIPKEILNNATYEAKSRVCIRYTSGGYVSNPPTEWGAYITAGRIEFKGAPKSDQKEFNVLALSNTNDFSYADKVKTEIGEVTPDLLVTLGNMVEAINTEDDFKNYLKMTQSITGGQYPVMYLRGEGECTGEYAAHIGRFIRNATEEMVLGKFYLNTSFGDLAIIGLDTALEEPDIAAKYNGYAAFDSLRKEQVTWLKKTVPSTFKKTYNLVFAHADNLTDVCGVDMTESFSKLGTNLVVTGQSGKAVFSNNHATVGSPVGDNTYGLLLNCADGIITVKAVGGDEIGQVDCDESQKTPDDLKPKPTPKPEVEIKDTSKVFTDIKSTAWYKQYVDYAVAYGLFSGTGEKTFSPNADMTRAQFVQVLANIAGAKLDNNVDTGFTDAPRGKWFTGAVKWAVENGVASGTGAGKFNPTGKIDRQQMCVMLVNYVEKYEKATLKEKVSYKTFADDAEIAGWAKNAVVKCFKAGLVSGTGNNRFSPKVVANRATGATIFTNFHKEYIA